MNSKLQNLSLRVRLVFSFGGVVLLAAALVTAAFVVVLVSTMKRSARENITETSKAAFSRIDDLSRGLEIYADLIASDMTFGQLLSYDSSAGITQKIGEFQTLAKADLVAFVPSPEQYVQIKDEVFIDEPHREVSNSLRQAGFLQKLLASTEYGGGKGWLEVQGQYFLVAAKTVLHFGSNMGVIVLGRKCNDELAKDIASVSGTSVLIFNSSKVLAASLESGGSDKVVLPNQAALFESASTREVEDDIRLANRSYLTLFAPLKGIEGQTLAKLGVGVSNEVIQRTRNQTLRTVLVVATLATILSALIGSYLAGKISNPLRIITSAMHAIIDKGDLGIRIAGSFGAEPGILANSFNRLLIQLQEAHEKLASSERRMKEELTMASTVQEMLFPDRDAKFRNLELSSFIDTSTETGGDWFGYGADKEEKSVTVLIGDVTGHGMPAALITATANGFFTAAQESLHGPISTAEMLKTMNQIILRSTKGSLLMTFFASVYEPATKTIRYSNAGHNRPFLCRTQPNGQTTVSILASPPSVRLGETMDAAFVEQSMALQEGDLIVWYTDGILECENDKGEIYGKQKFMTALKKYKNLSVKELKEALISDAYAFFGAHPRKDDITMVIGAIRPNEH